MRTRDVVVGLMGFSALWLIRNVGTYSLWWVAWLLALGSFWLYDL